MRTMRRTTYLDNAATSYPKPVPVIRAVTEAMRTAGNPGRGSHRLADTAAELVYDCRTAAAELFGAEPEQVVFTAGATHALNAAVKGLAEPGCHILIDNYAHNAALRPVAALAAAGLAEYDVYDADGEEERVLENIAQKLRPTTRLLIATHPACRTYRTAVQGIWHPFYRGCRAECGTSAGRPANDEYHGAVRSRT